MNVPNDDDVFFEDDATVSFYYDSNGRVKRINMNVDYIDNNGTWHELDHFIRASENFTSHVLTLERLEYFSQAEPLIPNFLMK